MANSNEYMNNYMKNRWIQRRISAVEYLGGSCIECGSLDNLEFDHIDPETKICSIAQASSFSEKRFWNEVDKCQLLCEDCHDKKHESTAPCGTVQRYWRGCKCSDCKSAYAKYMKEYKSSL